MAEAGLSASWMCRDAGLCSPVLLPADRLGSCTMKSDSVSIKQFDGLQRLSGDGDRLRNKIETSSLCGLSPQGWGKDTTGQSKAFGTAKQRANQALVRLPKSRVLLSCQPAWQCSVSPSPRSLAPRNDIISQ